MGLIKNSWRLWLPPAATLALLVCYLTACLTLGSGAPLLILLLGACIFPFFWPHQFGSWLGLSLLLSAILLPTLAAARWSGLETGQPQLVVAVPLWTLATWMMLPATLGLLLWRRLASIPVMLLGLAAAPVASLLIVETQINVLGEAPAAAGTLTLAAMLHLLVAATPIWFVGWACCLGPIFFLGTFGWLLYREATHGVGRRAAATPSPSARVEEIPRNAGTSLPGGS